MQKRTAVFACLALLVGLGLAPGSDAEEQQEHHRLNELMLKGSHNSYHKWPPIPVHPRHRYQHDSLHAQLEHHGVRAMEFDLHLSGSGEYQVYHIAIVDERSHCRSFEQCLQQIRAWSDTHRDHEPLLVWIEAKDFAGGRKIHSLRPVDRTIRRILGDRLITPDGVRGGHDSLRSALLTEGWPTLAESRGKILFMLTGSREQHADYTSGFQHLRDRIMFVDTAADQLEMGWAGVVKLNDPDDPLLPRARRARLLVSTTVCVAPMRDAECFRDRDRAVAAGANVLLDDYVRPTPRRDYFLDIDYRHIARAEPHDRSEPSQNAAQQTTGSPAAH